MSIAVKTQTLVADRLRTLARLRSVNVIARRKGDIVSDIEAAVVDNGAAIYVFPGKPTQLSEEIPGPWVEAMEVRVRILERPDLNRTAPDAYEIAELVLAHLHLWPVPVPDSQKNPLVANSSPIEEQEDPERTILDVVFSYGVNIGLKTPATL